MFTNIAPAMDARRTDLLGSAIQAMQAAQQPGIMKGGAQNFLYPHPSHKADRGALMDQRAQWRTDWANQLGDWKNQMLDWRNDWRNQMSDWRDQRSAWMETGQPMGDFYSSTPKPVRSDRPTRPTRPQKPGRNGPGSGFGFGVVSRNYLYPGVDEPGYQDTTFV